MRTLIIAAATLFTVTASGQSTFDNIINEVIDNNPELAAKRAELNANILETKSENNLSDPSVDFEHKWGVGDAENRWDLSVSQEFEWFGVYGARRRAAEKQTDAFQTLHRAQLAEKAQETKLLLIDLVNARQRVDLFKSIVNNIDSLTELNNRMFNRGEATLIDLNKLRMEKFSYSMQLETAETELTGLRQSLYALNNGKFIDTEALSEYPAESLRDEQYYLDAAETANPMLAGLSAQAEAAQLLVNVEKQKRLPGFSVGYVHEKEGQESFNGFSLGVKLPIFSTRHKVAAAQANAEAQSAATTAYLAGLRANIISTYATAKKEARSISEFNDIFCSSDYIAMLNKSYIGGQMTTIELLTEINYYCEGLIEYYNLQHSYQLNLATLNRYNN
jgi:outer membrane protein TolC